MKRAVRTKFKAIFAAIPLLAVYFISGYGPWPVNASGSGNAVSDLSAITAVKTFAGDADANITAPAAVASPGQDTAIRTGLNPGSLRELKIATYNIRDLLQYKGKSPGQLRESARAILDMAPDIMVLQEVENIEVLGRFDSEYLNNSYLPFLIEGNDPRGIDVAFLVKRNLPFDIEQRTHKDEKWRNPATGAAALLFSRDLPALIVRARGKEKPLLVMFGTHFKSKRTSPGDPGSEILRKAQVERASEIINRYRQEFGQNVPLLLAGDFNGALHFESAFGSLWKISGLVDTFDLLARPPPAQKRVTHTFHPRKGEPAFDQIDAILVSENLRASVRTAEVYLYKDGQGGVKSLPQSYEEREQNPSDHYPVTVTLDFQSLLSLP